MRGGGKLMLNIKEKGKGFTLIELLIVIVIIGILAGVLIAVINPADQQNRARNANTQATLNKLALAIGGYNASAGRIPAETELAGGINNFTSTTCTTGPTADNNGDCLFTLGTVLPLPATCTNAGATNGWGGTSTFACSFRYCAGGAAGQDAGTACTVDVTDTNNDGTLNDPVRDFRIFVKVFGSPNVYMYRSIDSSTSICGDAGTGCVVM